MKKWIFVALVHALLCVDSVHAMDKIKVAASSTYAGDLTQRIGGDDVDVKVIASPKFNAHFYEPTPRDVQNVRKAQIYVHWGLDMEAWSGPLVEAAGRPHLFNGRSGNISLSAGIPLLDKPHDDATRMDGDVHVYGNPHYNLDPRNFRIMAKNLANRLIMRNPERKSYYEKSLQAFLSELDKKILEWKTMCRHCSGEEILSYHDDVRYLTNFLDIKSERFLEPKPGIPPTAQHLLELEKYAKANGVRVIVINSYLSKSKVNEFANRINGKSIIIAQNVGEVPNTGTIFDFFDFNIRQLSEAFRD